MSGCQGRDVELTVDGWNCMGLSHERMDYVKHDIKQDVMVLQELHGAHAKYADQTVIVCDEPEDTDSHAGVMIVLSQRAADWTIQSGCDGSHIVWVRLTSLYKTLFIVGWYIPHKYRALPSQGDTIARVRAVISEHDQPSDVLIGIGDANARLQRLVKGYTGKYAVHSKADSGGVIMHDMMVDFEEEATEPSRVN